MSGNRNNPRQLLPPGIAEDEEEAHEEVFAHHVRRVLTKEQVVLTSVHRTASRRSGASFQSSPLSPFVQGSVFQNSGPQSWGAATATDWEEDEEELTGFSESLSEF